MYNIIQAYSELYKKIIYYSTGNNGVILINGCLEQYDFHGYFTKQVSAG